jgi:tetratricopeptide (TPR) repeat protein
MTSESPNESKNPLAGPKQRCVRLCQQGEFEQARRILETVEQQEGLDGDACFLLATIYGQLTRYDDALKYYARTLEASPYQLRAYIGRAKALVELRRFEEAIETYERVLTVQPNFVPVILDLGILLQNLGRFELAEMWFLRALELEPESERILANLGRANQALHRAGLARNYYERAIRINPYYAEAQHMFGTLLFSEGQVEEAMQHYTKALEIDETHVNCLKDLGYLHLCANRPAEARTAFQRAQSIQPRNPDVIAALAKLDDQSGDVNRAYQRLRPFLEGNLPPHPEVGLVFANICRHFGRCHEAAEYLERQLESLPEQGVIREMVCFALGKLYDRLGEYDRAFAFFEQSNNLKPDRFNRVAETACIDDLIRLCGWNFFVAAPRSAIATESPVFIVGMPRSGTTLTEQILASHPDVHGLGEISVFPEIILNLKSHLRSGEPYPANLKNLTPAVLDTLANTYLDGVRKLGWTNKRRFTDKTLVNYLYLGLIARMFPNARVIHCVRDPRDTCLSIFFQSFDESHYYANRLENIGAYYSLYRRVMDHWKSLLEIPILDLRYEDLVGDQEAKTRELIEFVGLGWDDRVLRFYETRRNVATASYDQVRQKIYTSSTARWKNYEKHIGPLVKAFDFPLEDPP